MLPRNQRMELLSKAYVRAIAAQAGCGCDEVASDLGIDLSIRQFIEAEGRYYDHGSLLDVQLKSTTPAGVRISSDEIRFDLGLRNYNHLRMEIANRAPRLLVVFIMPADEAEWVTQDSQGMVLRHCCYYLSLASMAETKNVRRVTVSIPKANVFSAEFLQQLQLDWNNQ